VAAVRLNCRQSHFDHPGLQRAVGAEFLFRFRNVGINPPAPITSEAMPNKYAKVPHAKHPGSGTGGRSRMMMMMMMPQPMIQINVKTRAQKFILPPSFSDRFQI
jgi:hypothetical protein